MAKKTFRILAILLLSVTVYIWFGYGTARADFIQVIVLYAIVSAAYLFSLYRKIFAVEFHVLLGAAMLLRLSLLFMTPNLTDDYFRYIWDGLLSVNGYNPYVVLPSDFINSSHTVPGINTALYDGLNSPNYYTIYPPICQLLFAISAKLAGGAVLANVIIIRLFILLAEFGTLIFLHKILQKLNQPSSAAALYAFNPLIIIELTGNIHLEAIMIFFLTLSIYLMLQNKLLVASANFGAAVSVKLIPLIMLPLLIKKSGLKKGLYFCAMAAGMSIVLFLPFLDTNLIGDFFSSFRLYFQTFEFNASFYYLLRWIGYQVAGYNMIAILGVSLAVIGFIIIVAIAVREKAASWHSLLRSMLLCLTVYFLLATTVHPWYITTLVLLSAVTGYRYPIVWSIVIMLSYAAYQMVPYSENLWLVAIEYIAVGCALCYELIKREGTDKSDSSSVRHSTL